MLAMTELETISDAMRREAPASVVIAPRLQVLPPLSETAARPQGLRASRPTVEEDDFDSMWEEGVASW
jgi:hypothetical protein